MEISIEEMAKYNYDFELEVFQPQIEEEFYVHYGYRAGEIDIPYLCRKERISHRRVRNDLKRILGKDKFDFEVNKNQISKTEFLAEYEFGEYRNVREWIGHMHKATGKLLTRAKLFQYLTEDNINTRWEVTPKDNFA